MLYCCIQGFRPVNGSNKCLHVSILCNAYYAMHTMHCIGVNRITRPMFWHWKVCILSVSLLLIEKSHLCLWSCTISTARYSTRVIWSTPIYIEGWIIPFIYRGLSNHFIYMHQYDCRKKMKVELLALKDVHDVSCYKWEDVWKSIFFLFLVYF